MAYFTPTINVIIGKEATVHLTTEAGLGSRSASSKLFVLLFSAKNDDDYDDDDIRCLHVF